MFLVFIAEYIIIDFTGKLQRSDKFKIEMTKAMRVICPL